MENNRETYMRLALAEAEAAFAEGEVPVGAVLVRGDEVIARAHNRRQNERRISGHAEMDVLDSAAAQIGAGKMRDCTLYVTLEPCPMCAGAIGQAGVGHVVFGAYDAAAGACGSVLHLPAYPLGYRFETEGGVLGEECRALLQSFFTRMRENQV